MKLCLQRSEPEVGPPWGGGGGHQGTRHAGPLDQALAVCLEAIDQPGEACWGGVEGGADGVGRHLLQEPGFWLGRLTFSGLRLGQIALWSLLGYSELLQASSRASQRCRI